MVRVANLQDLVEAGDPGARRPTGCRRREHARRRSASGSLDQRERAGATVERDLRPALAEHGIRIITPEQASPEERARARAAVRAPGLPGAHPAGDRARPPVPLHLQPLALARRRAPRPREGQRDPRPGQGAEGAAAPLPLASATTATTLVPLDALIAANLDSLFPGMEVLDHSLFRVTRDTDYDVSDEADDLLQAVEEELRRRRFGEVVRLEIDARHERAPARPADRGARRLRRRGLRGRRPARPRRPLGRGRRSPATTTCATRRSRPVTPPRLLLGQEGKESDLFAAIRERRHPRPPPLRLVHDLGRALRQAGGRRPRRARDQADRVPHERRLAAGPGR